MWWGVAGRCIYWTKDWGDGKKAWGTKVQRVNLATAMGEGVGGTGRELIVLYYIHSFKIIGNGRLIILLTKRDEKLSNVINDKW